VIGGSREELIELIFGLQAREQALGVKHAGSTQPLARPEQRDLLPIGLQCLNQRSQRQEGQLANGVGLNDCLFPSCCRVDSKLH
jgi:hypothetical protein